MTMTVSDYRALRKRYGDLFERDFEQDVNARVTMQAQPFGIALYQNVDERVFYRHAEGRLGWSPDYRVRWLPGPTEMLVDCKASVRPSPLHCVSIELASLEAL